MDQNKLQSDRSTMALDSLLKIVDKIIEICFSNKNMRDDL